MLVMMRSRNYAYVLNSGRVERWWWWWWWRWWWKRWRRRRRRRWRIFSHDTVFG
jgi:hypothetical protein